MCLPPELSPGDAGAVEEQFFYDVVPSFSDSSPTERRQAHNALSTSSILGKHALENGFIPHGFGSLPKLPKYPSPNLPSSDSASASLMARLEQSMMIPLKPQHQHLQQHQQLLSSTFPSLNSEASMLQLQHALLLQQVQQTPSAAEQQQMLLLAQQRLLQQSRSLLPGTHSNAVKTLLAGQADFGSLLNAPGNAPPSAAVAASRFLLPGNSPLGQGSAGLAGPLASHGTLLGSVTPFEMGQGSAGDGEKKCKRMESNRASAKRSRQRKQARMEELDKATSSLQEENSILCQKLEAAQSQIQGLKEKNVALEEEVGLLRKMLGAEEACKPSAASSRMSISSAGDNNSPTSCSAEELEKSRSQNLSPLPFCEGADGLSTEDASDSENSSLLLKCGSLDDGLAGDVFSELLACLES